MKWHSILSFAAALVFLSPFALSALEGQVVYTEGTVRLTSGAQTRDAAPGDTIGPGDLIATAAESLAVIDLSNGTMLKLREKTVLAVDAIGQAAAVSLKAGGVFTHILGKLTGTFSVRTDSAAAGVRGTEFFMAYGRTVDTQPDVWLCVTEGIVNVALSASGRSVQVEAGKGINIVGGTKLTVPRAYPWTRSLNWNMNPAKGKVADTTDLDQAYSDLLNQDYH
jgi:ferric-dicitrate binding protein FerR (iron transport regulator)